MIISPNNSYTQQKVTMDPYPIKKNEKKIYHIIGYSSWNSIRIYNNFESFKKQKYDELKLPINGYGTYWTIFKNCLYYWANNFRIVKINKLSEEKTRKDYLMVYTRSNNLTYLNDEGNEYKAFFTFSEISALV